MANRVEREIEEILSKVDLPKEPRPIRMRRTWRSRARGLTGRVGGMFRSLPALNSGNLMLAGIGVILLSLVVRMVAPQYTQWVVLAGLALFATAFVFSLFARGRGTIPSGDPYWRGQRIPRSTLGGPSPIERLQRWWRDRNRRRW
jgi:hypothetical protein